MLVACNKQDSTPEPTPVAGEPIVVTETILNNRDIIWGMDFLPDGRIVFTEKSGGIFLFDTATKAETALTGFATDADSRGQGGLLDICVHPAYPTNGWVYAAYSSTGGFINLVRFKISGTAITGFQTLHKSATASTWYGHYGSRILFAPDGMLYWSVGEGGSSSYGGPTTPHSNAQRLDNNLWGKVHRLNADGSLPTSNPLLPGGLRNTIFTYGNRNPQGLAVDATGNVWETEHGPQGGCEVNLLQPGSNYGWPYYSDGRNYDGTTISNGHGGAGITQPIRSWSPAVAPAGLAFINSPTWKSWNGNLLMGSLGRRQLFRLVLNGTQVQSEHTLLNDAGRIRNVKMGPDGHVYVSIEGPGRIVRLKAQ